MHNQLLHQTVNKSNITPSSVQPVATLAEQNDNEHLLNCRTHEPNTCLFKILPVTLIGSRTCIKVYAMFDEGSSITLLEENIANELGVKGHAVPLTLQWYNDNQITEKSRVINLEIKGEHENISFQLKNVHTIKSLDLPIQTFNRNQFREFANLPIANYNAVRPSLLIGLDNSHLSIPKQTVSVGINQPIAVDTPLGWVVYGPALAKINLTSHVFHVRKSYTTHNLHQLLEEYFSIEGFGVKYIDTTLESAEDTRAREILFATTKNIGQRYQVGLLWREDHISLPQSYEMAKRRLINVENKMSKDETYAKFYKAEMNKYIDKGYAKLLSDEEAQHEGPTTWYLPHFGVVNPHKPHKLRIVFDAAAAVANISLNSMLLKGPERAQPLMTIMFKFRQRKIAVAGDIEEMFSQVKIRHADIHSQRFLWRDGNPLKDIQVYAMTSMIFGAACSPCCAEYIKNFNANQFNEVMPQGVKAVTKNTYVDDLVISFDNVNEASEVITEAIAINNAAGFRLRNFVSNCKELQHKLNDNADIQLNVVNMERQPKTDKILGMYWNSNSDVLEFQFKFHKIPRDVIEGNRSPTKRELLGLVMAIYDPFGLLANITIAAKLILQATWKQQIDWDDPLPSELESHWVMWWKAFQDVKQFSVPRCFSPNYSTAKSLQLHIFVDASDTAYAAVAYLRIKEAHVIDAAFIAARTRCAPKRELTVPRLELQAAVLGSRLKISIEECLDRNIDIVTFWSDSKTVLLWIRSMKRDFKPFVACRISEILSTTTPRQWRWIPSALNVADEATKIKTFPVGLTNSRWVKGPAFLYDNEDRWPIEPPYLYSNLCDAEVCKENTLLIISNNDFIDILKYSSFTKLLRVIAWVLRFINNLKLKSRLLGELLPKELSSAENVVCRQAQLQFYETEINALQTKKGLSKSSQLFQLTPKLDVHGVLRINGRIDAAYCLPDSARCPIILPRHHQLSLLVMDFYHKKNHHQNSKLTINEMRQRYWIPHSHSLLGEVKRRCPVCIRHKSKPAVPLMGQLPPDRLIPYVRPFSYSGVDYCGPFFVAVGRRHEKRWIALFTCLTTRAVHLEIAVDLSTDAFMMCLRNFVNRRGVPVRIRSDNGTNFIGAQCKLKKEERVFDFNVIQRETAKERIEWIFNCPANPSSGGCWERLVQCVKRILQRVFKEETPRLETFRSVLIEAENIVNSRPLTDIPLSPDNPEPLTPNHFLLGCMNSTQTPSEPEEKICLRKQWRIAQNLKDRFWKRWVKEYLPQLLTRPKWRAEVHPLKPDQLVIVCDPSLPRSQWQTGRVVDVTTAKDGQVRSANVRTRHGIIRRPASKLAAINL